MSSSDCTLDSIPRDLAEVITRHLRPSARQSLFRATRTFCQQPTGDYVTGLRIALPRLTGWRRLDVLAKGSVQLLPHAQRMVVRGPSESSWHSVSLLQLTSTILPSTPALTTLELHRLSWADVEGAVTRLRPAACPLLANVLLLELHTYEDEQEPGEQEPATAPEDVPEYASEDVSGGASEDASQEASEDALQDISEDASQDALQDTSEPTDVVAPGRRRLWLALSALPALRHLQISCCEPCGGWDSDWGWTGDFPTMAGLGALTPTLDGLGAVTQLRSLSLRFVTLPLCELSQLVALATLQLDHAYLEAEGAAPPPPDLLGLSALQSLQLVLPGRDNAMACLEDFAPCRTLTSLQVVTLNTDEGWIDVYDSSEVWDVLAPPCTLLVVLDFSSLDVDCDQLTALPALQELCCRHLCLPPAGSGTALSRVRSVSCRSFEGPYEEAEPWAAVPPQPLTHTFPRLTALTWRGKCPATPRPEADQRLWEALLAAVAAAPLLHLTSLSTTLASPLRGSCCAAAGLRHLTVSTSSCCADGTPLVDFVRDLRPAGAHLWRLELSGQQISDAGLEAVEGCWPRVEEAKLWCAVAVTDAGLVALSRLPRLRRVWLLNCDAVTSVGVAALAERWSVELVEVCACAKVSAADVWRLHHRLSRPHLDLLHSTWDGAWWWH